MNLRRGPLADVYTEDGRTAVMIGDQVLALSELASTIVGSVPAGGLVELDDVAAVVTAAHGAPPSGDARDAVAEFVEGLVAHRVLERDTPTSAQLTASAVDAVRSALRHLLGGDRDPWRLPDTVSAAEFLTAAHRHRVGPALADAGARLDLPVEARAGLAAVRRNETATVEALARDLAEALTALERAAVPTLTFKGLALAAQAHSDASARGTGDLDLLVAPAHVVTAITVLIGLGWSLSPTVPAPGPSWAWRQFHRTSYEVPLTRGGHAIDLHWHLVGDRRSFGTFDELWAARDTVCIGPTDVATLGRYDALRHSAAHATKDDRRYLRGLYDIALLMRDPRTWAAADRPFSHGEHTTVGIASAMLGVPDDAPAVVRDAARAAVDTTAAARDQQNGQPPPTTATIPGMAMLAGMVTALRAHHGPADVARQLSATVFLPRFTALEDSPHAYVAAPRALGRRLADGARRAQVAAGTRRRTTRTNPRGGRP